MKNNIQIGEKLFSNSSIFQPYLAHKQVLIVTQQNIAGIYLKKFLEILSDYQVDVVYLPQGEQNKTTESWEKILSTLIENKHERTTTLIALGGGMIGDITGFAAACYQRGVDYIQIPTSLIAQVDSAIGGKTGVNHPLGKNLIGAFYHPKCILIDIDMLTTLPDREFYSGLAEVVKYGLVADRDFFEWVENNISLIVEKNKKALLKMIKQCIEIKLKFVEQDEKDQGQRRLLNFGHTFGHALENYFVYKNILHGEAVALGMLLAAKVSAQLGWIKQEDIERIQDLLIRCKINMDFHLPPMPELIKNMQRDKKITDRKLNLILLRAIGNAEIKSDAITIFD